MRIQPSQISEFRCVRLHLLRGTLLITLACLYPGCAQQNTEGAGTDSSPPLQSVRKIQQKSLSTPLTRQEVTDFLAIVRQLPNQEIPEFERTVTPVSTAGKTVEQYVESLRHQYSTAMDPVLQARHWKRDPRISSAFERLQVDPVDFASIVMRISCTWSAAALQEQESLTTIDRQLEERIVQLSLKLKDLPQTASTFERRQFYQVLEEMVALSTFVRLMQQVPEQSLQVVEAHGVALGALLPQSSSIADFERRVVGDADVIQVGGTRN